jgi:ABC-type glycerol-3-phosphate transport system substrate-binding protein
VFAAGEDWGLTILKSSPNQQRAAAFVSMLLGPVGTAALKASGPMPLTPATVSPDDHPRLPKSLQSLVVAR